jgi:hypothetical protein
VCHLGEVGVHAGVPATESQNTVSGVVILNVIALTGRANEGAGAATEAGFRKSLPFGTVKDLHGLAAAEAIGRKVCKGELAHNLCGLFLLSVYSFVVALFKTKRIQELFALFGVCLPVISVFGLPNGNITAGIGAIDTERTAEAGFGRSCTSHRNDNAVLSARCVIAVKRFYKKYSVKDLKALNVTSANTENYEVFGSLANVVYFDALAFNLEFHKVFKLREEEILGALCGVERVAQLNILISMSVNGVAVLVVRGDVKLTAVCNLSKNVINFVNGTLKHYSPLPSNTSEGSISPVV